MRPRVGSYVDTSTSTTSPGRTRMPRPRRMRPDGLASSWKPLSNSTSKVESGSIFTTVPRIRTYSSVSLANVLLLHSLQTLKLPQAIRVGPLPDESPGEAGGRYRPRKRTWGERCVAPDESSGVAGGRYRPRKRTWGERCVAPDESSGVAGGRYRHRKRTGGERCVAPDESSGVAGGRYRHRKRTWGERCVAPDESPGVAGGRYRHRKRSGGGGRGKADRYLSPHMPRMVIDDNSKIRVGVAIRAAFRRGYTTADLRADAIAGLVIGVVALPLSMALAIAAGAPPEHGLYTAIVAGLLIALTGGSTYSVSGPTAAFVVLLVPVTTRYGLRGLLVASLLAGLIMLGMGIAGLGRLIQFIPHPVTTGFTAGIAVVIA